MGKHLLQGLILNERSGDLKDTFSISLNIKMNTDELIKELEDLAVDLKRVNQRIARINSLEVPISVETKDREE